MTQVSRIIPDHQQHIYDDWHIAPAVRVGDLLICSGIIGITEDGSVSPDPVEQYEQVFANITTVLAAAGATLGDIVEMVTFHVDLDKQMPAFIEVKERHITEPYPAWTGVGVALLGVEGALVEAKITALAPQA